jgi:RHS repeat-associated protein
MVDAMNGTMTYDYDPFGNLTTTTDPDDNQIVLGYDIRGRKTSSNDPDMGLWTYTYNSLGELTKQTDAKGQDITFTYDDISRIKTRNDSATLQTEWFWDTGTGKGKGSIASITHPEGYSETYSYDTAGRPSQVRTIADSSTYDFNYSYDAWGRLYKIQYPTSTSGFRFAARYLYDSASGLLTQVVDDAAPTTVFWELSATNERGLPIDETLGNGLQTIRSFDRVTGWLESVVTDGGAIQDLGYEWDKMGNLTERSDLRQSKTETFTYDDLYRMTRSQLDGADNMVVTYDTAGIGNIKSKWGAGTYTYSTTHPHQVVSTTTGLSFAYDNNGNMTSRNGSTIDWTSYNLPKKIREGSHSSEFRYGPARARYKQINVEGGATETTYYIGGIFERVSRAGGTTEHRHYIVANGGAIAVHTRRSTGVHDTVYLHRDHLGSVDTVTDDAGSPIVRLSYNAFGLRRGEAWSGTPTSADMTDIGNTTRRGFTSHEHLDNIGLIHMNGRAYDPTIGRFLSADPFVTEPFNPQNFNRYSYVNNRPLSWIDPSGFQQEDNAPSICDGPDCVDIPKSKPCVFSCFQDDNWWNRDGISSKWEEGDETLDALFARVSLHVLLMETEWYPFAVSGNWDLYESLNASRRAGQPASQVVDLYVRSFSPYEEFGGGFAGDNRGFTTDLNATSRISGRVTINVSSMEIVAASAVSSPSKCIADPCLTALNGFHMRTEAVATPSIHVSTVNGDFLIALAGSNPLVPGAPDLDLTLTLHVGASGFSGPLVGDAFPNAEVFVIGPVGATMLHTFQTSGGPATGPYRYLPGDNKRAMGSFGGL